MPLKRNRKITHSRILTFIYLLYINLVLRKLQGVTGGLDQNSGTVPLKRLKYQLQIKGKACNMLF